VLRQKRGSASLAETLDAERRSRSARSTRSNCSISRSPALRSSSAALEDALEVSEAKDRETQAKIADLGRRLNVALAQRVQELNRYRSDFFGRLREILASREDVRVVGDRFVFQSEVLFPSGGSELNPAGQEQMAKLAEAIIELAREIPDEINWVLRVDGHTDNVPLSGTGRYADNWELSSARATSVVKYPDQPGRAGQPSGGRRLWRVSADRRWRQRPGPRHQPAHRAQADRALSAMLG
jgi:chemotaxis protein MotB